LPVKVTCWGLEGSEFEIRRVADFDPVEVGRKVTLMVQLAPAARLVPQLLDCENMVELVPVREMLMLVSVVVPTLVRVTVWAALVVFRLWLPKFMLEGETVTPIPDPVKETV
jgi:hypothetical protein